MCLERGWIKTAREERAAAQMFFNRLVLKKKDPKLWSMVERVNVSKDKVDLEERRLELEARKYKDKKPKPKKVDESEMTADEKGRPRFARFTGCRDAGA